MAGFEMDIFNLEGNKVSKNLKDYDVMLYGAAKLGKTTFAYRMYGERALFLSTEVGYRGLKGIKAINITKWSDLVKVTRQLKDPRAKELYDVLVVDTVDLLYSLAEKQILSVNSVEKISDIPYGAGFKMVDNLFNEMILSWQRLGFTMMFISHATQKEEEIKMADGSKVKVDKYSPTLSKRGFNIINKFCDNIFYGGILMDNNGEEKRCLFTRETVNYVAGSRWKYLDEVLPLDPDAVNEKILEAIKKEDDEDYDEDIFKKEEKEKTFEEVKEELTSFVMNKFYPDNMNYVTEAVEKTLGIGQTVSDANEGQKDSLEIILVILQEKAEDLRL